MNLHTCWSMCPMRESSTASQRCPGRWIYHPCGHTILTIRTTAHRCGRSSFSCRTPPPAHYCAHLTQHWRLQSVLITSTNMRCVLSNTLAHNQAASGRAPGTQYACKLSSWQPSSSNCCCHLSSSIPAHSLVLCPPCRSYRLAALPLENTAQRPNMKNILLFLYFSHP